MKSHVVIAVSLAALSSLASAHTGLAGDITVETDPFVSSRAPSEVRAELTAYKKSGINPWSRAYNPLLYFKSTKSRETVTADFVQNRDVVAALNGEDSGSVHFAAMADTNRPAANMARGADVNSNQ